MSNTDQAQEPTMEEILASIRRIISDDDVESTEGEPEPEQSEEDVSEFAMDEEIEEVAEEVDFDSLDVGEETAEGDDDEDVLELTDVIEDEEIVEGLADDIDFDSLDGEAEEEPEPEPEPEPVEDAAADIEFVEIDEPTEPEVAFEEPAEDRIISDTTDTAVATAFGQLASTLLSRDGHTRTLEELVQEMLRPMLKSWLDENLPSIVEELVRQEIERAARRGAR